MIADRLDSEKIVFGLEGTLVKAIDELCARSSVADLASHFRAQKPDENERYSCIGHGIAVPHVRVDHLAAPELVLGLSPEGLSFNNRRINIVLLLATPAEQPPQHLQLLQRIGSLLPAIRDELLAQRDAVGVLRIIARAEQQSALPTYLNLTQEQIGFELQSDLTAGLTSAEAQQRLRSYGPNLLQRWRG